MVLLLRVSIPASFHFLYYWLPHEIVSVSLLCSSCADAHTIEFQKRGLPHAHILVWQADCGPEPSAAFVDQYISAEIPDPREDPLGFVLVQEFMMHGPCGELNKSCLCMKDGRCTKKISKDFPKQNNL